MDRHGGRVETEAICDAEGLSPFVRRHRGVVTDKGSPGDLRIAHGCSPMNEGSVPQEEIASLGQENARLKTPLFNDPFQVFCVIIIDRMIGITAGKNGALPPIIEPQLIG